MCVPSPKGIDFDQKPELSLPEVARTVAGALGKYDFIVTNFANGDVIGHTQNTAAKLDACGYVSRALEQVVDAALAQDYVVAITADHGNIEKLYTVAGKPDGSHTTNLVPFILIDSRQEDPISLRDGALCDVAPTILDVMGLPQPLEMTGRSLAEGHTWSRGRRMLLIICDGWGLGAGDEGDAIHLAHTPYWDALLENRSWCRLQASREFVGLGAGKAGQLRGRTLQSGGAGRCVMQDDVRLDAAVQDGSFARNPVFLEAIEHARRNHASLHLLAYLTHKSSHGCIDYPLAICEMAKKQGLEEVTSTSSSTAAPPNPAPPRAAGGAGQPPGPDRAGADRGRRWPGRGPGPGQELRQGKAGIRCPDRRPGRLVFMSADARPARDALLIPRGPCIWIQPPRACCEIVCTLEKRCAMKTVLGYLRPHAGRVAAGAAIKFTAAVLELILPPAGRNHRRAGARRRHCRHLADRRLDVAAGSWGGGLQHYRQPDGRLGLHGDDPGTAPGSLPPDPGTLLHPGRPILTLLPGVPPHQ